MAIPRALLDGVPAGARATALDLLHRWRWRTRYANRRITERFVGEHGLTVAAGPLGGMRFPRFAVGRAEMLVPQLLGAYEQELHPPLEEIIAGGFQTIVDIGASDGYYVVGLALACPQARVLAFEVNAFPARVCEALATENGVRERIDLRGECTIESLRNLTPSTPAFVLCDCEGFEAELMDPERVPWLRTSTLIVELHEFAAPGVSELIPRRFAMTHDVERVASQRRYAAEYPALQAVPGVSYIDRELGVSEFRSVPISWAVLRPR